MKRLPPLPTLHTFQVVAQCLNFTHAAARLHITQGAVSRQIAALESHLGYPLFLRQARGLALTPQGQALFPRIEQVFALIHDAVGAAAGEGEALRLKAPTCAMRWLWPRLMRWRDEHPNRPVELTTTVAHGVAFHREAFDAALVYGPAPTGAVSAVHLFDEQLTPVCSPRLLAGPLPLAAPADLARHMLLHPTCDETDWGRWLKAAGAEVPGLAKGQHFETLDLAMSVAAQGAGVAIGDYALIAEDLAEGRLVAPFALRVATGMGYWLVAPRREREDPRVVALFGFLAGAAGASPGTAGVLFT
ncbi:LysR substrate-binding domain-containing protein [Pseudomonas sp. NPDC007930]|uniref:LysR substrate-binding domain-containing protein n=1 Tax=Pseudomonas sp. NPDC007930 TaxID=3364417 RepID=UPI0036E7CC2D